MAPKVPKTLILQNGLMNFCSLINRIFSETQPQGTIIYVDVQNVTPNKFNQDNDAVVVSANTRLSEQTATISVQFLTHINSEKIRDGGKVLVPYRSGGVLEISFSDNPKYKIIGCVEGELQLPNITSDESVVELRVVKRYPWFSLKYNGVTVVKHNFFSFKNVECRGVWAIESNVVTVEAFNSKTKNMLLKTKIAELGLLTNDT